MRKGDTVMLLDMFINDLRVVYSFGVKRVPPAACAPSVISLNRNEKDEFLVRVFGDLLSPKLLEWLTNRVNNNLMSDGARGPKVTPYDTNEIAALFRMLVGYINNHDTTFKEYMRETDRLGYFIRKAQPKRVTEARWNMFMNALAWDATGIQEFFELVSEGLRSVVQIPTEVGTAELALDESMIAWSCADHKYVVYLPRKPEPLGKRAYLLAMILFHSGLPVVLSAYPDMFDEGFYKPTVCCLHRGEYNAYF